MLIRIPAVLDAAELARCRALALGGDWADGRLTAGTQSAEVKNNRQLPEGNAARAAREVVLAALARNALFFTAALPKKIYPPLFNRYDGQANSFGNHIDNAVRTFAPTGQHVRTDLSATLFLSAPADYEGGELVIEDTYGAHRIKLAAGDMVLYPASSVHRVEPVTAGSRLASFFWIESMVRDDAQRRILFDLDTSIIELRAATPPGDGSGGQGAANSGEPNNMKDSSNIEAAVRLTGCYHNLLRMWADP